MYSVEDHTLYVNEYSDEEKEPGEIVYMCVRKKERKRQREREKERENKGENSITLQSI